MPLEHFDPKHFHFTKITPCPTLSVLRFYSYVCRFVSFPIKHRRRPILSALIRPHYCSAGMEFSIKEINQGAMVLAIFTLVAYCLLVVSTRLYRFYSVLQITVD